MKNVMKTEILTVKKKRQKSIEKELGCEFNRINPDAENYVSTEIGRIHNHITELTKESSENPTKTSLIEKISKRLLELKSKSNHSIKFRAFKFIVKKYCHHYKTCTLIV